MTGTGMNVAGFLGGGKAELEGQGVREGEGRGLAHGSCASEHSAFCGSDLRSTGVSVWLSLRQTPGLVCLAA